MLINTEVINVYILKLKMSTIILLAEQNTIYMRIFNDSLFIYWNHLLCSYIGYFLLIKVLTQLIIFQKITFILLFRNLINSSFYPEFTLIFITPLYLWKILLINSWSNIYSKVFFLLDCKNKNCVLKKSQFNY